MVCLLCHQTTGNIIARELRGGEPIPVFYCEHCQLGMLSTIAPKQVLKKFYATEYRKIASPRLGQATNPKELFELALPLQSERIKLLKKYFGKSKRLLEVGCSAGMFLWHARKYLGEVVGIDYDQRAARFAAKQCACQVFNTDILDAVELGNLIDLALVTAEAAKARSESRGAHYREDFPKRDDLQWMKHSLASMANGKVSLKYKPVVITKFQPQERKY